MLAPRRIGRADICEMAWLKRLACRRRGSIVIWEASCRKSGLMLTSRRLVLVGLELGGEGKRRRRRILKLT